MRYRYLDDFGRGISVFAIFSYGIAVLGTPQCPPPITLHFRDRRGAVSLRYSNRAEITVPMCDMVFVPTTKAIRGSVNIAS